MATTGERLGGIGAVLEDELERARAAGIAGKTVVLVEGESDRRALIVLGGSRGLDLVSETTDVVAMTGATNLPRFVALLGPDGCRVPVLALCDEAEAAYFRDALPSSAPLFVCVRDLEDELIRAIGIDRVVDIFGEYGDSRRWHRLLRQPEHRESPRIHQVRRFIGNSFRKIEYAERIAAAIRPDEVPDPLRGLLDAL